MLTVIGILAFVAFLFWSIFKQDKKSSERYHLKYEYKRYWLKSNTFQNLALKEDFRTTYEGELLNGDDNKKLMDFLAFATNDETVKKEIARTGEKDREYEFNKNKREIYLFENIDSIIEIFNGESTLDEKTILNRLVQKCGNEDAAKELFNNWRNMYAIHKDFQTKVYRLVEMPFTDIVHPFKIDKYGQPLTIKISEYLILEDKKKWREREH